MIKKDFIAVLKEFADDMKVELIPDRDDFFELRSPEQRKKRRIFLRTLQEGDDVTEFHYSCLCGIVDDPDDPKVLKKMLTMNRGGGSYGVKSLT